MSLTSGLSRNKDQLKFISSHVGIVVTEESFIKIVDRESLTRDDEITFGVNEDSSGRGNADKVFVWNKKIVTRTRTVTCKTKT